MNKKNTSQRPSSIPKPSRYQTNKIAEHKQSERIMLARLRLGEFAYTHSLEEVLQATLDEVEILTGSTVGFYHFLEPDEKTLSLQAWSTRTLKEFCTAVGRNLHYDVDQAGVWVDCIRERRPVIHNDYASLPHRKGIPEGHATVIRELVVPVRRGEKIVSIIGVGNKPTDYDKNDIKTVSLFANLAWDIVERKRDEMHIQYLGRLYAILSQVNQAILRMKNEEKLFEKICDIVVNVGKFHTAWIGLIDETSGKLKPVMHIGDERGYKQYFEGSGENRFKEVIDSAWRTGKLNVALCRSQDHGKTFQSGEGHWSFASIPFSIKGKVRGTLNLCTTGLESFNQAEMTLLNEIGADISFALDTMELARENKQAEEKMRQSEERFRRLAENAQDVIYKMSLPDGKYEYVSPAAFSVFGYAPEEFYNNPRLIKQVIHPDWSKYFEEQWANLIKGEMPATYEYQIIHKSGETRWLNQRNILIRESDGRPIELEGIVTDITERKLTEEKAKQLAAIVQSSEDAIIGKTLDGIITSWNKGAEKTYGYSQSEVIGQDISILLPPDHEDEVQRVLDRLRRGECIEHYEAIRRRKDGREIHMSLTISPILNADGRVVATSTIGRDITERKRAEEALRSSEEQLSKNLAFQKQLIASLPTISFITTDLNTIVTSFSPGAEKIFGYRAEEIIGQQVARLHLPEDVARLSEIVETQNEGHVGYEGELTLVRKNGELFPAQFITSPIQDEQGNVIGFLGVSQDITERKRTAESLKESETRLQSLIQATPDAIFFKDGKGRWLLANSSALQLFDLVGKPYTGKTDLELAEMVPSVKETLAYCTDSDEKAWHAGTLTHAEETVPQQDSSYRAFDVIKIPLYYDDGSRKGLVIIGRDVTERRQADAERHNLERELMQAQKLESLGTLASGIAHDFNNILGIILGYSSLLERTPSDPEKIRQGLSAIQRATMRGASIVKQLLTFARKSELAFVSVSINNVVDDITTLLRGTLPKTIDMVTNLNQKIPHITADASQIHQVLLNLCVNARDAMPKGGRLSIATSIVGHATVVAQFPRASAREYVTINVKDTGMGMDDKTKQRIFDPFFTTKGPGKGTGLGLALVYSIVESHHGMIAVESAPGKGTTFSLYFPVEESGIECSAPSPDQSEDIPGGAETILLIEDEEMFAEMVKGILVAKGYSVLTAYDGEEGLQLFQQHKEQIAAVLTDFGLPKYRGDEVFKRIKAMDAKAKVILASGFIEPAEKSEMLRLGLNRFIQKPYSPSDVLRVIRNAIDNKR